MNSKNFEQDAWPVIETMQALGCKKAIVEIDENDNVSIDMMNMPKEFISTAPVRDMSTLAGLKDHHADVLKGIEIQQEIRRKKALIDDTISESRQNMIGKIDPVASEMNRKASDAVAHKAMLDSMQKKRRPELFRDAETVSCGD